MYIKFLKRLLDIVISLCFLPVFGIVFLIFAPIIWLTDNGPVFYVAERRGKNEKIFNMYKFRSMHVNAPDIRNADNSTYCSEQDPRVTKIGKFIRKLSIDETPQVMNVLKGDMSWVGPRALIPIPGVTYNDLTEIKKKRLQVKPGITGYTAALYRNSISTEEKYKFDCYYIDHISLALDIKIIFWTIKSVLSKKNIYTNSGEILTLQAEQSELELIKQLKNVRRG